MIPFGFESGLGVWGHLDGSHSWFTGLFVLVFGLGLELLR